MSAHPRPSSMRYLARVLMDSGMSGEDRDLTQRQSLPVWLFGSIGWSGDMKVEVEVEVEIILNLVGMKKDSQDAVRGKMILKDMKLVWVLSRRLYTSSGANVPARRHCSRCSKLPVKTQFS
jgi:hypothetical protein